MTKNTMMSTYDSVLRKYLDIYSDEEMYFVNDIRTLEIFKLNPQNTDAEIIRMKTGCVNDIEMKSLPAGEDMVGHILSLNIDRRLTQGDLSVVEDIANIPGDNKKHSLLHFASAYCNFHRPEVFPIYSEQYFEFYYRYITNYDLPLDLSRLNTYPVFCAALNDLVKRLGLSGKMNYLHLRKFAWLYGEKVASESAAQSAGTSTT